MLYTTRGAGLQALFRNFLLGYPVHIRASFGNKQENDNIYLFSIGLWHYGAAVRGSFFNQKFLILSRYINQNR